MSNQVFAKRKSPIVLALVLALSLVALSSALSLSKADPYIYDGNVPPDPLTKPPNIQVFSPQNNSVFLSNNVSFSFYVTKPESPRASQTVLTYIYYKAGWLQNTTFLYNYGVQSSHYIENFSYSDSLTEIPDGKYNITIYADGMGWYPPNGLFYKGFEINGSSTIFFTVETIIPGISVSLQNKSYTTNDIPLNITLNKSMSKITYSLDGHENVTTTGNTTLNALSNGEHNLIAYAEDNAGYTGATEKIYFYIQPPQPFPTSTIAAVSAAIAAVVVVACLLFYSKKTKRKAAQSRKFD
jgi:hypothetical protein